MPRSPRASSSSLFTVDASRGDPGATAVPQIVDERIVLRPRDAPHFPREWRDIRASRNRAADRGPRASRGPGNATPDPCRRPRRPDTSLGTKPDRRRARRVRVHRRSSMPRAAIGATAVPQIVDEGDCAAPARPPREWRDIRASRNRAADRGPRASHGPDNGTPGSDAGGYRDVRICLEAPRLIGCRARRVRVHRRSARRASCAAIACDRGAANSR